MKIKINGPFTGSYSLSMVNRHMALALEDIIPGNVALSFECHPEGPQSPDQDWLENNPDAACLYQRSKSMEPPDVILYNSYPPTFPSVPGSLCLTNAYGWEESLFPGEYVRSFNANLQGMTLMSEYVQKTMRDNGVTLPMTSVGLGIDHIFNITPDPWPHSLGHGFRFLHVSSCFPRKGLDILLASYRQAFTAQDHVTLVIKTFPNPHNNAPDMIQAFRQAPEAPEIILINEDISDARMLGIYQQCHCLVAPSRGEGFGLPMAEAMALNIPVITTGYGGQTDFCTPETAWLIEYSFAPAKTHLTGFGSCWAEPDPNHLTELMRQVYETRPGNDYPRVAAARGLITSNYTWSACARRILDFASRLQTTPQATSPAKTGLVTTWNCRCGIAEYSRYLLPHLLDHSEVHVLAPDFTEKISHDEPNIHRCWHPDRFEDQLPAKIQKLSITSLIINFHSAFFQVDRFKKLIHLLKGQGVKITIIFHAVKNPHNPLQNIIDALSMADKLLVHTIDDLNYFKSIGLESNVALFPHGVYRLPEYPRPSSIILPDKLQNKTLISSFGFLMPHKGVMELIHAFSLLLPRHPDLGLLLLTSLYPKQEVMDHHQQCLQSIYHLNIQDHCVLIPDFLPLEEALQLLSRTSLIVYPYQHTSESSSAAVRMGLGADRPVAVTPLPIFDDVLGAVHVLPGPDPESLAQGIDRLLSDPQLLTSTDQPRSTWLKIHDWTNAGKRLQGIAASGTILSPSPE